MKWSHQEVVRQTIEWLDYHDILYWDLCFMSDKSAVGAHLYVEDSPSNIESLRAEGHKTIVFTNSTNLSVGPPRADSWSEIETLVLKEQRTWRGEQKGRAKAVAGK